MKVCLIQPPTLINVNAVTRYGIPPIGLAYIGASLIKAGHQVQGLDAIGSAIHQYTKIPGRDSSLLFGLKFSQICERISPDTQVIGISVMFSRDWLLCRDLIKTLKQKFPQAIIIAGGEHITSCAEYVLSTCQALDIAVLGEGDETIVELLEALEKNQSLHIVNGIAFREKGLIQKTPTRKRISDLDSLPEPAWEIFPLSEYIDNAFSLGPNQGRSAPLLTSRGCPFQCTFCSNPVMWSPLWRARSATLVVEEMKKYIAQFKVDNFDLYDLTAIVKKDWIIEFCQLIVRENLNISWQLPSGTRSEAIDEEVADWLFKSGCKSMSYAPESGSPEELKRIKKKVNLDKMLLSIRAVSNRGMKVKANIIFGMPGAGWKDVLKTYVFLLRLAWNGATDVGCFSFSPYPGSELFHQLLSQKKISLNEKYFQNLNSFNNFSHTTSFNDNFSGQQLSIINIIGMALFYGSSMVLRPQKMLSLLSAIGARNDSNALARAITNLRRRKAAKKMLLSQNSETIQLPTLFKPKSPVANKSNS